MTEDTGIIIMAILLILAGIFYEKLNISSSVDWFYKDEDGNQSKFSIILAKLIAFGTGFSTLIYFFFFK